MDEKELVVKDAIRALSVKPKGILAADESESNLSKKFSPLNIANVAENRRLYREMLFTSEGIEKFIGGVIVHEETFDQKIGGKPCAEFLADKGILVGVKLDRGLASLNDSGEWATTGLDTLNERAAAFFARGARFAKWRTVYKISDATPSAESLDKNAVSQAEYAAICLANGLAPIVEPEVLAEGAFDIDVCREVTAKVLRSVFRALRERDIDLTRVVLKPNMVVPGLASNPLSYESTPAETVRCLRENVPESVPLIVFLSGGQAEETATENLAAIVRLSKAPWRLSFSYGRALQDSAIKAWAGSAANVAKGQAAFLKRAELNAQASIGL